MKKSINKSEKAKLAFNMTAASITKGKSKIRNELVKQQNALGETLRKYFEKNVTELSRARTTELLQQHVLRSASVSELYLLTPRESGEGYYSEPLFGVEICHDSKQWARSNLDTLWPVRRNAMADINNMIADERYTTKSAKFKITGRFADVGYFDLPTKVYDPAYKPEKDVHPLNDTLYAHAVKIRNVLRDQVALLIQAGEMYIDLVEAFNAISTTARLLELFPEAVAHLSASMNTPKPSEVMDPTHINDLRAKLKAGLPV